MYTSCAKRKTHMGMPQYMADRLLYTEANVTY